MVKLMDIMPELQKNSFYQENTIKPVGQKRRAWLEDDVEQSENVKGVHKPGSSTPLDKGVMKGVDHCGSSTPLDKGVMNGVYEPGCLFFDDLRSNPLQLILFLFSITKDTEDYSTRRVTLKEIMEAIDISKDSARTALRFLLKRLLIARIEFKEGRLGWSRYALKTSLFKEIETRILKGDIPPFNILPKKGSNSSNSLLNTTTNHTENSMWGHIDVSPLESIGLTTNHLLQLKSKSNPEIVQCSINHFSYALQHNSKVKNYSNPIAALISVLKRGDVWIEPNYQSQEEMAMKKIIENKKMEIDRRKALEDDAYKTAFIEWQKNLTLNEIEQIAPAHKKGQGDLTPQSAKLSIYFKLNIWPVVQKDFGVMA